MRQVTLADKYDRDNGQIFLTGVQALVRLPLMQRRIDMAAGHNTAGFISGYQGSPLGTFDLQLHQANKQLDAHNIVFKPGLNEDLAAAAVWGSQHVGLFQGATVDGVFGLWYGKAPGVDRSGDVFKHANFMGTSALGGVLAIAGDDHGCKSSTLPSQSEFAFLDAEIPILNPADIQETLEYGLFGLAMSRFAGAWTALKVISDTMDSTAMVDLDQLRQEFDVPTQLAAPVGGRHMRLRLSPLEAEAIHRHWRLPAALEFARLNAIDRIVLDGKPARVGIICAGRTYLLVRQALVDLGIDEAGVERLGIRLLKVGMPWPLDERIVHRFAKGLEEVVVIEERRALIEPQVKAALYGMADGPRIVGKLGEDGKPLVSDLAELSVDTVSRVLASRFSGQLLPAKAVERLAKLATIEARPATPTDVTRTPYFCSGCPHNSSTKVPEGSRAMAGIGCHYLALRMDRQTETPTHMGAEGVPWIGQAPFTSEPHVFANLGDGTYSHSGVLALRWAINSGVNITYKILVNGVVAMTGGQTPQGELSTPRIAAQVRAEGVERIAIVSDDPDMYKDNDLLPAGVTFHHRRDLDAVQRELRDIPGTTVLLFDQACATEKRRLRKRGAMPQSNRRMFINDRVCEACGDCSVKSNCLSIEPLATSFGQKRKVNQHSCNMDFSCAEGFCPSFVSVEGGRLRRPQPSKIGARPHLPVPAVAGRGEAYNIVMNGIGGLGVTSATAILGMAAHLEGKGVRIVDTLGLAQKGGAVYSYVRIAPAQIPLHGARFGAGTADLLLAGDIVEAGGAIIGPLLGADRTAGLLNSGVVPTAEVVQNARRLPDRLKLERHIAAQLRTSETIDASGLSTRILGDPIYSNLLLLGFACQKGWLPVGPDALEAAIELNGERVEQNKQAFGIGRMAAHDPSSIPSDSPADEGRSLADMIDQYAGELEAYQNASYAVRYRELVDRVRAAERALDPASTALTEAVARQYFRLLAYKDEYEVARLHSSADFRQALERDFEGDYRINFHLSPPLVARKDPISGEPRKYKFGPWIMPVFRLLARLRFLRGTPFDLFGWMPERRHERRLANEYREDIEAALDALRLEQLPVAIELAALPEQIKGFGHIKAERMEKAKSQRVRLKKAVAS